MTRATWITMIAMFVVVWGGFLLALGTAVRKESGKARAEDEWSRSSASSE